jgi:vesicle coat complex subunit
MDPIPQDPVGIDEDSKQFLSNWKEVEDVQDESKNNKKKLEQPKKELLRE